MSQRDLPPVSGNPVLLVDASSGNEVVNLPKGFASGRSLTVRRRDSSTNTVTVTVPAGDYLDGVLDGTATVPGNGEQRFSVLDPNQWETFGGGADAASLVSDPLVVAAFAPKLKTRARTILANIPDPAKVFALYGGTATVTLGASGGVSSITSAVRRYPRVDNPNIIRQGQTITPENDPVFRFLGIGAGIKPNYPTISPDNTNVFYPLLTGGVSQNAKWRPKQAFIHTGQVIEFCLKATATTILYRLTIDGLRVSEDMASLTSVTSGSVYTVKVDFGSIATRRVEWESDHQNFGGVFVEPTATIHRAPPAKLRLATFGDSHVGGADGINAYDAWTPRCADLLGCDEWLNLGIGGSGYLRSATNDFRLRLPDIIAANPDILIYYGSYNDAIDMVSQAAQDALQAEATYCLAAIKAALPDCLVFVGGCHPSATPTTTVLRANAAVKAAAAAVGYPFIDAMDPLGALGTVPNWAGTTIYSDGAVIQYQGAVHQCIAQHTSTGSFDPTKWRATSWIFGSGKAGSTTGDGNADVFTNSGGVHMTAAGHRYYQRRMSAAVIRQLELLAA